MCLVVFTYPNFFINKNALESHTYNLKALYKIFTGRKYYEFYMEVSPNCSILASIFQKFPGGMPSDPLHAGTCASHTFTQEISTFS